MMTDDTITGGETMLTVQSIKETLAAKEAAAQEATPDGMEFEGWVLDGWIATNYTPLDANARPVYSFKNKEGEE